MAGKVGGGESIIEVDYLGSKAYEWTIQVPPRSTLAKHLSVNSRALQSGDLKFVDGVLGKIDHAWKFQAGVTGVDEMNLRIWLWLKKSQDYGVTVHDWELHTLEGNRLRKKQFIRPKLLRENQSNSRQGFESYEMWNCLLDWTDDSVDSVRVVFNIQCEPNGKVITLPSYSLTPSAPKETNAGQFFLSEHLSDVVIVSGGRGQEFPAHRFRLACESPVFCRMFQNPMKESLEGRVVIDDMKPTVLKEMLYFIYHGKFTGTNMSKNNCVDLFKSAEKYEIQALKTECAKEIAKTVTFKNALEVYILGETHNDQLLMHTAEKVLKRNKTKSIQDPTTLRKFTNLYPELAFKLFNA